MANHITSTNQGGIYHYNTSSIQHSNQNNSSWQNSLAVPRTPSQTQQSVQIGSRLQTIAAQSVNSTTTVVASQADPFADWQAKIDGMKRLYDVTDRPVHMDDLRKAIPRPTDPLLDDLIDREGQIVASSKSGDPKAVSDTLESLASEKMVIRVSGPETSAFEPYTIWKDPSSQHRMIMDHGIWKVDNILLKKIPNNDPLKWSNVTTNMKTCTSVLSNQDATFCGNEGALVYLAPVSQDAVIAAGPHDVNSPSETHDASTYYSSARNTVQAYLQDQEKFRLTHDGIDLLKHELLAQLEQYSTHSSYDEAKETLQSRLPSTFEKRYYTEDAQPTNLEISINQIISALILIPELELDMNITVSSLEEIRDNIDHYLNQNDVIERGVQRESTTGWELKPEKEAKHVLGVKHRTIGSRIEKITSKLKSSNILTGDYAVAGESLDLDQASEFGKTKKEIYFRNIFRNVISNYTVDEAVKMLDEYRTNSHYGELLENLTPHTHEKTYANALRTPRAVRRGAHEQKEDIKDLQEALKECSILLHEIQEAKEMAKMSYTEIQVYSDKVEISGIGLKEEALLQVANPDFPKMYHKHTYLTDLLATYTGEIARLNSLKERSQSEILQKTNEDNRIQAQISSGQLDPVLGGRERAKLTRAIREAGRSIQMIEKKANAVQAKAARAQSDLKKVANAVSTYKMLKRAHELNIPCFVHYGPKEEFPSLPQSK